MALRHTGVSNLAAVSVSFQTSARGDNIDLGTDGTPFSNFNDPEGADHIWFTADDGYSLRLITTAAIKTGVNNVHVPTQNITLCNRNGNVDVEAYDYIP